MPRLITYRSVPLCGIAAALPGAALGLFFAGFGFDPMEFGRLSAARLGSDFRSSFLLVLPATPVVLAAGFLHAALFNRFYRDRQPGPRFVPLSALVAALGGAFASLALGALLFQSCGAAFRLGKTLAAPGLTAGALFGFAVALWARRRGRP